MHPVNCRNRLRQQLNTVKGINDAVEPIPSPDPLIILRHGLRRLLTVSIGYQTNPTEVRPIRIYYTQATCMKITTAEHVHFLSASLTGLTRPVSIQEGGHFRSKAMTWPFHHPIYLQLLLGGRAVGIPHRSVVQTRTVSRVRTGVPLVLMGA